MFPVICRLERVRVRVLSWKPATVGCSIDTEQSTRVPPNRRHKVLSATGTAELDLSIWSMAVEPVVLAPVLGEPSLPAMTPAALDISPSDLDRVKARIGAEGLTIRGYRFHSLRPDRPNPRAD